MVVDYISLDVEVKIHTIKMFEMKRVSKKLEILKNEMIRKLSKLRFFGIVRVRNRKFEHGSYF